MDQITNPVTIEQLMQLSVNQLSAISVPASLTEQIAIPIYRVINNLKIGLGAIANAEAEKQKVAEPVVEDVTVEEIQNGSDEHED